MLKISKGLKKKKKSKKNKHKEDELFTEAELEEYKRQHAQKAVEETEGENSEEKKPGNSEEFEKFKLLTAGVDDVLKKSQGDLDRIKKESFFQRKPTPSEIKALEEKEKAEKIKTEGNWTEFEGAQKPEEEERQEESESEYEIDENDDLFDTAYVDALESGEIKLAYIPDDDEVDVDEGPDPFDTTTAEQILKKVEEEERKKKKQISLGLAVNVLTGRAERDKSLLQETGVAVPDEQTVGITKARKRPRKIQDFSLLGSFDDNGNPSATVPESTDGVQSESIGEKAKSLLDDDLNVECELPEGDVLITEVLVKQVAAKKEEEVEEQQVEDKEKENLESLVNEFDVINDENVAKQLEKLEEKPKPEEEEDEFDEFTALATSSVVNQKLEEELQKFEVLEDDPFDTSAANVLLQEEPEKVDIFGSIEGEVPPIETSDLVPKTADTKNWTAFDEKNAEDDPFDTAFVKNIQPGKCELKLLENEILGDIVAAAHKSDIHQEARILSRSNSDSDFNPREGEETPKQTTVPVSAKVSIQITDPSGFVETQRGSESEVGENDLVSLNFSHRDLLGGSTTDLSKLGDDPLPPASTQSPLEDFSKYSDPFDTSIVDQVSAPGKAELKFIENELLSDIKVTDIDVTPIPAAVLNDDDFDPREDERNQVQQEVNFDLPSPTREEGARPLTPHLPESKPAELQSPEIEDPFDTSYVTSLPGKEELKLIEKELEGVAATQPVIEPLHKKLGITEVQDSGTAQRGVKHSLSDPDFNPRDEEPASTEQNSLTAANPVRRYSDITGLTKPPTSLPLKPAEQGKPDLLFVEEEHSVKALTPAIEEDISSYIDPFDTSIAEKIVPGKAELRVLENELVTNDNEIGSGIKRSYTDPDFNPRDEVRDKGVDQTETPAPSDILNLPESSVIGAKPLTPVDFGDVGVDDEIDPFDTSIATNLLPGKAELRILESELFGQ